MAEWIDATANWYAENYGEYATNALTIEHLALAPDATVLDIGCGTASAPRHAAAIVTTGRLIGVDPVPRMIEIAQERVLAHPAADRIALYQAPAHALPVDDASVDVVLALDSYAHWGEHAAAGLREVRRVMAPEGRFVVVRDASVPFADDDKATFLAALREAGFTIRSERVTERADVVFTTWIATA